ncbi:putative peroxide stress protein YaaA [Plasmopara halstedii]
MTSARLVYVISPAKTLDLSISSISQCSQPRLLLKTHQLVEELQKLSQAKVKSLLKVNDTLAKLNYDRYQMFDMSNTATKAQHPSVTLKQAALTFNGPAYQSLNAYTLSERDLGFAQHHLCILSGLYGILRPLDLIQPYRLEMGQKFSTSKGQDLYDFWGKNLIVELDAMFCEQEAQDKVKLPRILINLASQEYFKCLSQSALETAGITVVNCVFQDDGKIKSVYAKRARGLMSRYLIQERVMSLEDVSKFHVEGYQFSTLASNSQTFVFQRSNKDQKVGRQKMTKKSLAKRETREDEHKDEMKLQVRAKRAK